MAIAGLTKKEAREFLRHGHDVEKVGRCLGQELDPYTDSGYRAKQRKNAWVFLTKVDGICGKAWVRIHIIPTTKGSSTKTGWSFEPVSELEYLTLSTKRS